MTDLTTPLANIFATTDQLIPLVLDQLTDRMSRTRARDDEGPSISWHLGHLLHYRCTALDLLGMDAANPYRAPFFDNAATDGANYPTVAELREQWAAVSARLLDALAKAGDDALAAPVSGGAHAEQTVLDKLAFTAFHEGYHMGGIAAIQKQLGLQSPPEKIMAQMTGSGG